MYRVLSVQSHVVYGYVGNKCACLPLQLSGYEVDTINSVQFSCHALYPHFGGQILKNSELEVLYTNLLKNGINSYDFVLSGYVGDESFLIELGKMISDLKKKNPNLVYYCDPVLGDNGKYYVPQHLLHIYLTNILPLADVICPNQFEAELISGMEITNEIEAIKSIEKIQNDFNIKLVVLTSIQTESSKNEDPKSLSGFAVFRDSDYVSTKIKFTVPFYDQHFVGTGDLFTALVLAHFGKVAKGNEHSDLKDVFMQVCTKMHSILKRTVETKRILDSEKDDKFKLYLDSTNLPDLAKIELRIVESINDIIEPKTDSSPCRVVRI